MVRILWVSNSSWSPTGYGTQTKLFTTALRRRGHQIAELPFYGYAGAKSEIEGVTYYGIGQSQWGDDVIPFAARDWEADIVITLMDIWVLQENLAESGIKWCPWTPVDHEPVPPDVAKRLWTAYKPIAMSKFGLRMMEDQGIEASYIPHGVDTNLLYPEKDKQADFKEVIGFDPDSFLVGMVAANKGWPSRKGFTEAFEAFAAFHERVPEARLYVHTVPDTRWSGPDLVELTRLYGIDTEHVRFPVANQFIKGFNSDFMRKVYNAFDVLINPAYGEGFGLTPLEAQACGTPVISTDFSAMTELVGAGWLIKPERKWWTPLRAWQVLPSIQHLSGLMENAFEMLQDADTRESFSLKAREFALQYDVEAVIEKYWNPYLNMIEEERGEQVDASTLDLKM